MGYTHYWEQKRNFTVAQWQDVLKDIGTIVEYAKHQQGIALGDFGGDGGTHPVFNDEHLGFNGVGDDSHETFYIERKIRVPDYKGRRKGFGFTKTARKPYDVVVVACLCYLATVTRKSAPDGSPIIGSETHIVSSDGHCSDFLLGLDMARQALPRYANTLDLPMSLMQAERWTGPWISGAWDKPSKFEVRFCVDGKGYVLRPKTGESYCFESHLALAQFLEKNKRHTFAKGGTTGWGGYGRVEEDIWSATGSFDPARHDRIAKAQDKVLSKLFPVDPACAQQPPAYVRPGEMLRESTAPFCYSIGDVLNLANAS